MEGPTPVSALIHAATMVTAGVYLIVRSNPIYDLTPDAQTAVVVVGAITLLSTGRSSAAPRTTSRRRWPVDDEPDRLHDARRRPRRRRLRFAIFHLLTHGFFKANMFLGRRVGDARHGRRGRHAPLRRAALGMPVTFLTFGLGYLAIIGFPPFSGFWSKDKIIETAFDQGDGAWRPGSAGRHCSAPASPRST
jgi:NADH-quinone oxidoreductase subunit L